MSKVLAVGDIHTKIWIIDAVEKIAHNYDTVVFVGDYADDWGKTAQDTIDTWNRLRELQSSNPEKFVMVTGNHDYLYAHKTPQRNASGWNSATQLIVGADIELMQWLLDLPISVDVDGVVYSHAGYNDYYWQKEEMQNTPQKLWDDASPIWVRPGTGAYAEFPQVFGHTPSKTCWEVQKNIWCIDTFSTYRDGTPLGDQTVLEVVDGKTFTPTKLI